MKLLRPAGALIVVCNQKACSSASFVRGDSGKTIKAVLHQNFAPKSAGCVTLRNSCLLVRAKEVTYSIVHWYHLARDTGKIPTNYCSLRIVWREIY